MNHADFCVMPMARWTSHELIPVLEFTICHMTISHLSRPIGESSITVPVFKVNCGALCFSRQCQRLYFSKNRTFLLWHRGQTTPLGHRRATRYSRQFLGSEKYRMASCRLFGSMGRIVATDSHFVKYI